MYKKAITYTNFNEQQVTRYFYFHLSAEELAMREAASDGTFSETLRAIGNSNKGSVILPELVNIIKWTYGVKSDDGEQFIKNDEVWLRFKQSPAYSALIMEFFTDENAAATFINKVMPPEIEEARKRRQAAEAQNGFRPGAQNLPQSRIDQLNAEAAQEATVQDFVALTPADVPFIAPPVLDSAPGEVVQESTPREILDWQ